MNQKRKSMILAMFHLTMTPLNHQLILIEDLLLQNKEKASIHSRSVSKNEEDAGEESANCRNTENPVIKLLTLDGPEQVLHMEKTEKVKENDLTHSSHSLTHSKGTISDLKEGIDDESQQSIKLANENKGFEEIKSHTTKIVFSNVTK